MSCRFLHLWAENTKQRKKNQWSCHLKCDVCTEPDGALAAAGAQHQMLSQGTPRQVNPALYVAYASCTSYCIFKHTPCLYYHSNDRRVPVYIARSIAENNIKLNARLRPLLSVFGLQWGQTARTDCEKCENPFLQKCPWDLHNFLFFLHLLAERDGFDLWTNLKTASKTSLFCSCVPASHRLHLVDRDVQ